MLFFNDKLDFNSFLGITIFKRLIFLMEEIGSSQRFICLSKSKLNDGKNNEVVIYSRIAYFNEESK